MARYRVLFVCMGNICRSPTAEAVGRRMAELVGAGDRFEFDSAGTHDYHVGRAPDPRAIAAGAQRGYDLAPLRARRINNSDFKRFDLVLAMDDANHAYLLGCCPADLRNRLGRLLDFAPQVGTREVPDPYYGNRDDFECVIDLIEQGIRGLLVGCR